MVLQTIVHPSKYGRNAGGFIPKSNDGRTVHRLTVRAVPVDGFWSISVYNAKGFFQKNALDS